MKPCKKEKKIQYELIFYIFFRIFPHRINVSAISQWSISLKKSPNLLQGLPGCLQFRWVLWENSRKCSVRYSLHVYVVVIYINALQTNIHSSFVWQYSILCNSIKKKPQQTGKYYTNLLVIACFFHIEFYKCFSSKCIFMIDAH